MSHGIHAFGVLHITVIFKSVLNLLNDMGHKQCHLLIFNYVRFIIMYIAWLVWLQKIGLTPVLQDTLKHFIRTTADTCAYSPQGLQKCHGFKLCINKFLKFPSELNKVLNRNQILIFKRFLNNWNVHIRFHTSAEL